MTFRSIRARLLSSIAAIQIVGALVATVLVVQHEQRQSYRTLDASLHEHAAIIQSLIEAPSENVDHFILHRESLRLPPGGRYRLTDSFGRTVAISPGWYGPEDAPPAAPAISEFRENGITYRTFLQHNLPVFDPEPNDHAAAPQLTLVYAEPTSGVVAHIHSIALRAILSCLALLIASTIASAWAIGIGLRPLHQLALKAAAIDAGNWVLAELEQDQQAAELVPVSDALKSLLTRLRAAFERERQFFGDAAHEMKSSIAIVRSTLQLALQADRSARDYRAGLEEALNDTNRLQSLVTGMLHLVRIEGISRDTPTTQARHSEIHAQIERVVHRFSRLAKQKRVYLNVSAALQEQWVNLSEDDLFIVVSNLVENAIQHSSAGDQIELSVVRRETQCFIHVVDHGEGISQKALPHIFERFFRGDESRARATGGNGLGLSIVRALLGKVNGSISVESSLGHGSSFIVTIPISTEIATLQQAAESEGAVLLSHQSARERTG